MNANKSDKATTQPPRGYVLGSEAEGMRVLQGEYVTPAIGARRAQEARSRMLGEPLTAKTLPTVDSPERVRLMRAVYPNLGRILDAAEAHSFAARIAYDGSTLAPCSILVYIPYKDAKGAEGYLVESCRTMAEAKAAFGY